MKEFEGKGRTSEGEDGHRRERKERKGTGRKKKGIRRERKAEKGSIIHVYCVSVMKWFDLFEWLNNGWV